MDGASGEDVRPIENHSPIEAAVTEEHWSPSQYRDESRHFLSSPPSHRSPYGRLVGFGLLVAITLGTLGVIALNALHRPAILQRPDVVHGVRAVARSNGSVLDRAPATGGVSANALSNIKAARRGSSVTGPREVRAFGCACVSRSERSSRVGVSVAAESHSASVQAWTDRLDTSESSESYSTSAQSWVSRPSLSGLTVPSTTESLLGDEFGFEQ